MADGSIGGRFADRAVVVTGAARGIGRGLLQAFHREGARVLAVDRDSSRLASTVRALPPGNPVETAVVELGRPGEARRMVEGAVERLNGLHVLVNNAGVMPGGAYADTSEGDFDETMAVNVRAPFFACQAALRHMIPAGGGAIVNIASANALRAESPRVLYNASKAALVMLSRSVAHEHGHLGVRCNCVAPGEIITPEEAVDMDDASRRVVHNYLERIPMRRAGVVTDIAAAVLFLASDEASFITGQTLLVDGGELTGDWFDTDDRPPTPAEHWWLAGAAEGGR
jgi:NAD(P)-dependent dehydrogenase (short-subunit alcohol dehydrogenase family)